jgi:transcriptional regulator with XRE-family HTH domain
MTKHEQHIRFGAILRQARVQADISLQQAADCIGITTASLSRMETGISNVSAERLAKLAAYYGVSAGALFEGQLIQMPTQVDIDRMKAVVLLVHEIIATLGVAPSPEKIADVTAQVYTTEIERLLTNPQADLAFNADHHRPFITMVFKK